MRRLCRNCAACAVTDDGAMRCEKLNKPIAATDNPPLDSTCWTKREKLSGEALSLARARAGRSGGGGRPKGYGNGRAPTKQLSIRLPDYQVLAAYSDMKFCPLVHTVHLLCKSLVKQYPDIKPEAWVD